MSGKPVLSDPEPPERPGPVTGGEPAEGLQPEVLRAMSGGDEETAVISAVRRVFAPHLWRAGGRRFWEHWRATLRRLRPLGAVSVGNRIRVHSDGDEVYQRMWAAMSAAREHILLDTYLLEPDPVGRRTLQELREARARGVRVELILDAYGSSELEEETLEELRAEGIGVLAYNPILRFATKLSRLVRNHHKILVCDRRVAFCGGMNISCDYAGEELGNSLFRDTHLSIEGPCALDLLQISLELLGETTMRSRELPDSSEEQEGALVQILESNIARERRAIQRALRWTIRGSQERCYITTPYFVPPYLLTRNLIAAARRGVDVRILTAGRSDVPVVTMASRHLYGRLLRGGVRIFEMTERTLHAKTATIDGVYGMVGSFNLDRWSYRRNLEVTVGVLDRRTVEELEGQFEEDLELSREVKLETWSRRTLWERIRDGLAYQVMRI